MHIACAAVSLISGSVLNSRKGIWAAAQGMNGTQTELLVAVGRLVDVFDEQESII
ncbi:MAG TPA: hypothetical protein VGR78_02910 [Verrucomicrobiae bacterium]|jgi:hypothetical protein|nr:hypothetical protein [Verrucomicrobiae bacterium]